MQTVTTTKEIRQAVAYFSTMPKTNKFKRAVDLALAQSLPLLIEVAGPFKSFKGTTERGKTVRAKVRIKNTRTGQGKLIGQVRISEQNRTDYFYKGRNFIGFDIAGIEKHIGEPVDMKDPSLSMTGPHTEERNDGVSVSWGEIARIISKLFKEDFAHTEPCWKCGGSGFLPHYAHIDNGTCWDCMGSGQHLHLGDKAIKAGIK